MKTIYKQTIWYEIYSGRKINREAFDRYFDKNGDDETWYIYYVEEHDEPCFELHAHISGNMVDHVEPFKADVYGGHGRPIIDEKNLTAAEKKYAVAVFDECFPDRASAVLANIIDNALLSHAAFGGYDIVKAAADSIVFSSPEGKRVKLNNKHLVKAIDYSHIDIAILRDAEVVRDFAHCFGIKNYEPLAAILLTVDPTGYEEYEELERQYRYAKMEDAIKTGCIEMCQPYADVLSNPKNSVHAFCEAVVKQDNQKLLIWIIDNIAGATCNLTSVLGTAVKTDKEDLFYYLINSGFVDAQKCDATQWYSPMHIAAYDKGHEKYVVPLLKHGFALPAKVGYRYFSGLSFTELEELLPYDVEFDLHTIERIYREQQETLIKAIEKMPLRYCPVGVLLYVAIKTQDFSRFRNIIEKGDIALYSKEVEASGFRANIIEWFEMAYANSPEWADVLIENGFDVNCDDARLLHDACKNLNVDMAIYLIEHGANPKLKSQYSETVFEKAAGFHGYLNDAQQREKERLCKYLLNIGLDPIMESRRHPSIITNLLGTNEDFDLFLVDWLADHNAINKPDTHPSDQEKRQLPISSVIGSIIGKYNPHVLRRFVERGAKMDARGITDELLFLEACKVCDLPELQLVVSAGANIYEAAKDGTNGIYAAVQHNSSVSKIEYLISLGLNVNAVRDVRSLWGVQTPPKSVLDLAEELNNVEMIECLKSHGALHESELS